MGADQLFECRHLAELRIVLTEQQQVRRVGHRVLALQAHDRVRSEELRRVLAFDAILVEVPGALRAEDHGPVLPRSNHHQAHAWMRGDRGHQPRVQFLELFDRQSLIVAGEPHEPQVAGAHDGDGRRVGDGHLLLGVEVDHPVCRLALEGGTGDRRTDALARRDLRQERIHECRTLGLGRGLDQRRAAAHELAGWSRRGSSRSAA